MRRRIAIGLLAGTFIGAAVLFVLQRNGDSVEWHRQRYVGLLTHEAWPDRFWRMWSRLTGRRQTARASSERTYAALQVHEKALVRLGYFEERRFLVFTRRAEDVMMRAVSLWRDTQSNAIVRPHLDALFIVGANTNAIGSIRGVGKKNAGELAESVVIVARPEHMPAWAEFVQRSDPPRSAVSNVVYKSSFIPVRK